MIKVNLLPVKIDKRAETLKVQAAIGVLALLLTLGICYWFYSDITSQVTRTQQQARQTQQEIEKLKSIIGEIDKIKNRKADLEKKLAVISDLEEGRFDTVRMMESVALALPEQSWLESLAYSGNSVSVDGYAFDNQIIAEFIQNLNANPQIGNVVLSETARKTVDTYDVVSFKLTFNVKPVRQGKKG